MSNWGITGGGSGITQQGADAANSRGVLLAVCTTTNTKGPWTEMIATTTREFAGFWLHFGRPAPGADAFLLDVGLGAAGSEQIIAANLPGEARYVSVNGGVFLPIAIPSGVRLAMRWQATKTDAQALAVHFIGLPCSDRIPEGFGYATAVGVSEATSLGVTLDCGASVNTKGAWIEVSASTPHAAQAVIICQMNNLESSRTPHTNLIDVGVGAAGSEVVVVGDVMTAGMGDEALSPAFSGPYPVDIPASSRIAIRGQSSNTGGNGGRDIGAAVILIN